jgi:hypothetical protein
MMDRAVAYDRALGYAIGRNDALGEWKVDTSAFASAYAEMASLRSGIESPLEFGHAWNNWMDTRTILKMKSVTVCFPVLVPARMSEEDVLGAVTLTGGLTVSDEPAYLSREKSGAVERLTIDPAGLKPGDVVIHLDDRQIYGNSDIIYGNSDIDVTVEREKGN